ncbi:MAG TPA: GNAT family N-acetyltransferase [Gemmatimonadales bacterium]|nr:GNAT family N-acetyltransferase [Gemmatimonadales bacterium]
MTQIEVRRAGVADLDLLVPLFDAYRQFYQQPSDPALARRFLAERIERNESVIFLALAGAGAGAGTGASAGAGAGAGPATAARPDAGAGPATAVRPDTAADTAARARPPAEPAGFTQLYPIFSSTRCRRSWLLNDLFVAPAWRAAGVARRLMEAARRHGVETGAWEIELMTAHANTPAQALYESLGYELDREFRHYVLRLER